MDVVNRYRAMVEADVRRTIIELLQCDPDHALSDHLMAIALHRVGHVVGVAKLRQVLLSLKSHGLVKIVSVTPNLWTIRATTPPAHDGQPVADAWRMREV